MWCNLHFAESRIVQVQAGELELAQGHMWAGAGVGAGGDQSRARAGALESV